MRTECLNNKYVYDTPLPINRLVAMVGSKSQIPTQRYGRRPFGVGLLVAGYDVSFYMVAMCICLLTENIYGVIFSTK